ncbi:adenylate kinase [Synechococcus elongatus]|uniref:Adenylate kinase n=1 Tax=Synechococcus elongatus PCC 11802 TaxID=2283154 RepID=A0AAT9JZW3_SYNEL|nr:adenylate kinase [Synechococcus elongatus]QFZ92592.1 adenylate kinase [Synechococcus elongatus PCC 11802]
MKKVAIFGNAGGGKSTLSRQLAEITGLPLYTLDKIKYRSGGVAVSLEEYQQAHQQILEADQWIIDGFGSLDTLWPRLDQADTLVYVDLPIALHFWWVTKRWLTGYFHPPMGWPEGSPLFKSSMSSYQVLWLCHRRLTPKYRDYVQAARETRTVYHLRSAKQVNQFVSAIAQECKTQKL